MQSTVRPQNRASCIYLFWVLAILSLLLTTTGCHPRWHRGPEHGAEGIGDPYFPHLGNGGYDVQNYTVKLDVDPEANYITGSTSILAMPLVSLSSFSFDFHGLTVDSVTINGQAAAFKQFRKKLIITPPAPLEAQAPFTVLVVYHGSPGGIISSGTGSWPAGWEHERNGSINVFGELDGASTWFPNNNHPRDKATFRFEITAPEPWAVAATGRLVRIEQVGKNKRLYVWIMKWPMASYLASINIDKYEQVTFPGPDGVTIRSFFPANYPLSSRMEFDVLPEMIKFLSNLFGPYPFDEYGVVIASDRNPSCTQIYQSLEAQTLTIHCPAPKENVIIHELAHQWFGDSVSLENWQDIWLKEGLATYAEWLWASKDRTPNQFGNLIKRKSEHFSASILIGRPPVDDLYNPDVYIGGALVLQALRMKVGDTVFFKILRTYYIQYRDGNAGTQQFIDIAEKVSRQDLKTDFDQWLYTQNNPLFTR